MAAIDRIVKLDVTHIEMFSVGTEVRLSLNGKDTRTICRSVTPDGRGGGSITVEQPSDPKELDRKRVDA
jgi:hypothetical protein